METFGSIVERITSSYMLPLSRGDGSTCYLSAQGSFFSLLWLQVQALYEQVSRRKQCHAQVDTRTSISTSKGRPCYRLDGCY